MTDQPFDSRSRQRGRTLIERTLILVLASIVVTVILMTMGSQVGSFLSDVVAAMG